MIMDSKLITTLKLPTICGYTSNEKETVECIRGTFQLVIGNPRSGWGTDN